MKSVFSFLLTAMAAAACLPVDGDRITAADLARALPAFAALAPQEPLGLAPAPGMRRSFYVPELLRIAKRLGVRATEFKDVCFERPLRVLDRQTVLAALRRALPSSEARLELLDFSLHPVPGGELEFTRSGFSAPAPARSGEPVLWRGRVRYAGRNSFPVWARVKVGIRSVRVVARENLSAGQPVEARQLALESYERLPFEKPAIGSVELVAGRALRRSLRAGQPIAAGLLVEPNSIERGDTVAVAVSSGAAQVKLDAVAESPGRPGDRVMVRNPASGRRFPARVDAKGKVTVTAPGTP